MYIHTFKYICSAIGHERLLRYFEVLLRFEVGKMKIITHFYEVFFGVPIREEIPWWMNYADFRAWL